MADDFEPIITDENGDDLDALYARIEARTRALETGAAGFSRAIARAFASAATGGKQLDDVLKGLALRLSELAVRAAFKPLERGLTGGLESLLGGLFGGGGNGVAEAFAGAQPFADGGVIARPTYFPLGAGRLGLAGEAGPEAVLPLARGADGRLGVAAGGRGAAPVAMHVHIATPDAESFRRSEAYLTGQIARAVSRGQRSF